MHVNLADIIRQVSYLKKFSHFPFTYSIDIKADDVCIAIYYAIYLEKGCHCIVDRNIPVYGFVQISSFPSNFSLQFSISELQQLSNDFTFSSSKKLEIGDKIIVGDLLRHTYDCVIGWLDTITDMTIIMCLDHRDIPLELILPIIKIKV